MNKTLLKQALLFKDELPQHSKVKKIYELAVEFQNTNGCFFLESKRRQRAKVYDFAKFFEFISDVLLNGKSINSFEEIEDILNASTRQENIYASGDSKNSIVKVFNNVVVYQVGDENPMLYKNHLEIKPKGKILAVENGETFLNIFPTMSKFGFNEFVYLGGNSNKATRDFLKDKDVVFFLDYDIFAIHIYDSFTCKKKEFFRHPDLEKIFSNDRLCNEELYRKQLKNIPSYHDELHWLLELIKRYNKVVEQEVFNDSH